MDLNDSMALFVKAIFFCKYALRKLQIEKYPDMCGNGHKYNYWLRIYESHIFELLTNIIIVYLNQLL